MSQSAAPVLTPLMRVFCAWCKKELAPKPVAEPTDRVSHGICQVCKAKLDSEIAARQLQFIDEGSSV